MEHRSIENTMERVDYGRENVLDSYRLADECGKTRDAMFADAARHDEVEMAEVWVDVQREAVAADAFAAHADADSRDFRRSAVRRAHPDAGITRIPPARDAERAQRRNNHAFDVAA